MELAAATAVDQRNMGATVRVLVGKGWVRSRPHPGDGRAKLLSLSRDGRLLWEGMQPQLAADWQAFFAVFTEEDLVTLNGLLQRLDRAQA